MGLAGTTAAVYHAAPRYSRGTARQSVQHFRPGGAVKRSRGQAAERRRPRTTSPHAPASIDRRRKLNPAPINRRTSRLHDSGGARGPGYVPAPLPGRPNPNALLISRQSSPPFPRPTSTSSLPHVKCIAHLRHHLTWRAPMSCRSWQPGKVTCSAAA